MHVATQEQWIAQSKCVRIFCESKKDGKTFPVMIRTLYVTVRGGESFLPSEYRLGTFVRQGRRFFSIASKKHRYQNIWENPNGIPSAWTITDDEFSRDETMTRDEITKWMNARFPHATSKALNALLMSSEGTSPAFRL